MAASVIRLEARALSYMPKWWFKAIMRLLARYERRILRRRGHLRGRDIRFADRILVYLGCTVMPIKVREGRW
jgi:hypothetical protein